MAKVDIFALVLGFWNIFKCTWENGQNGISS